jgi:hypothetical protein
MRDRFSPPKQRPSSSRQRSPQLHRVARWLSPSFGKAIGIVIVLALSSGALLLVNDLPWLPFTPFAHAPISAAPLLLIGLAALGFQFVIRPKLLDLFKACLVSAAFLLWGIDQLLHQGWLAITLGDVVIVLYVIDLGWMMLDGLKPQGKSHQVSQEIATSSSLAHDLSESSTLPLHILPPPSSSSRAPQLTWPPQHRPPSVSVSQQTTPSSSLFKRYHLLPLSDTTQRRQPSAEHEAPCGT